MEQQLHPPRECVVDLALLLEEHLKNEGEDWCTGDQVMDVHTLKKRLAEEHGALETSLRRVHLQGIEVVMTREQKRAVRRDAVALAGVCMHILQATGLLDPLKDMDCGHR